MTRSGLLVVKSLWLWLVWVVSACASGATTPAGNDGATPSPTSDAALDDTPTPTDAAVSQGSCVGLASTCGATGTNDCCASNPVPGGEFLRSYDGITYTDPSFPATVSAFRLDTYEVTVGRFRRFLEAGQGTRAAPPPDGTGAHPAIANSGWQPAWNAKLPATTADLVAGLHCHPTIATWTDTAGANESRPINCVGWYMAFAFCAWDGGRLPTEAEWNFAAAGGAEQREYPWGNQISPALVTFCPASGGDCIHMPEPVGRHSPASDGAYGQADLAGNVWEPVFDHYADPYAIKNCVDCGALSGMDASVRGGSILNLADYLRVSFRYHMVLTWWNGGATGIRCARGLPSSLEHQTP